MTQSATSSRLAGQRVLFLGKLAGMSRRDAQQLVRAQGGTVSERLSADVNLVVVGEHDLPPADLVDMLEGPAADPATAAAVQAGTLAVVSETGLWQRLGFVESEKSIHRLYTPAMLAELLKVPVSVVRRWHRRGLIRPVREVRRLPYFDFQEVATARRLAELLAAGASPQSIERQLAAVRRLLPGVERPLTQLSIIVEGKGILLRQGDGLLEPGGQLRFDFGQLPESDAADSQANPRAAILALHRPAIEPPLPPSELLEMAAELEDSGELETAAALYRATLAAGGPSAEVCFRLAELLYRLGEPAAARERYHMAIEIDEDFVEARANLGCVLAELGETEFAVAAFEGALALHADYPDAHFHLARLLDELGRAAEARDHWSAFLALAPESPWATTARERLGGS